MFSSCFYGIFPFFSVGEEKKGEFIFSASPEPPRPKPSSQPGSYRGGHPFRYLNLALFQVRFNPGTLCTESFEEKRNKINKKKRTN